MTCLTDPDWAQHLREMVQGAFKRGADGIFFDNLWHGCMPIDLLNTFLGPAGCYCRRCKRLYLLECGEDIPTDIRPDDPSVRRYLRWRADQVTRFITRLATYAREQ